MRFQALGGKAVDRLRLPSLPTLSAHFTTFSCRPERLHHAKAELGFEYSMYNLPGYCPVDFRPVECEPSISDETMPKPRFHITRISCIESPHPSRSQVCNIRSCSRRRNQLALVFDTPAGLEEECGWNT